MNALFVVAVFPPLFVLFAWAVLTLIRYAMPERKLPSRQHRVWLEQQMQDAARPTLVGASEIRETQRRISRRMAVQQRYTYSLAAHTRRSIDVWMEDLWDRRN